MDYKLSPHANAKLLFDSFKQLKDKMAKIELNQGKAVEAVKKKTRQAEVGIRKNNNRQKSMTQKGGLHWFTDNASTSIR